MSGTKKDRVSLKNRFKRGMYPTEDDFADVFESYLHKDDTIPVSKVTVGEGGEPIGNAIDKKADKQTLETFINEMETVLETVRDENTNEITHTVITDLAQRITDAENDIANAANAAETNGDSIAKILTILGKQDGETVTELASRFSALSGDYATVFAFISKVKNFLESADIADTTINRWQEIESFLQGITDTETLTSLLQQMKQEILAEIPEPQPQPTGNYLELVEDLDDYTDAPDGKIVKYVGQTNEKYTRGFDYEKTSSGINVNIGDLVVTIQEIASATDNANLSVGSILVPTQETVTMYGNSDNPTQFTDTEIPEVGHKIFSVCYQIWNPKTISEVSDGTPPYAIKCTDNYRNVWVGNPFQFQVFIDSATNERYLNYNSLAYDVLGNNVYQDDGNNRYVFVKESDFSAISAKKFSYAPSTQDINNSSWQSIPSFNVIN
ncbi:MAG: hypothetical protein J6U21_01015 [Bacteroidales bacterium]|nr:hypothetical protein [Bacteroidales bacterium]